MNRIINSKNDGIGKAVEQQRPRLVACTVLDEEMGLRRSCIAQLLAHGYGFMRLNRRILSMVSRLEGGSYFSYTLRRVLWQRHGVYAGAYSYGQWTEPGAFPPGVTIGRYTSIASNVKVLLRNHPYERLSMHPFFYNQALGYLEVDTIPPSECWIGHDAWIGESAIVAPGCSRIGIGAVVGAGSVVTKDVPDFAIVAGNPARVIKFRFEEATRIRLLESRWWERPLEELLPYMDDLTRPIGHVTLNHPLLIRATTQSAGNPGKSE